MNMGELGRRMAESVIEEGPRAVAEARAQIAGHERTWQEKRDFLEEHAGLAFEVGSILSDRIEGREAAVWDTVYESIDEIYENAARHILNDMEEEITASRRVMVPYNLLVWVTVDTTSGEVTEMHASDIMDNYWPDVNDQGMPTPCLYYLEDWENDGVTDPVDSQLAEKARQFVDNTALLPKLKIVESSR